MRITIKHAGFLAVAVAVLALAAGCRTTYPIGIEGWPEADAAGGMTDGGTFATAETGPTETGGGGDAQPAPADSDPRTAALAVSVSAGSGHACALYANKTVTCWGENDKGQLGTGSVGYTTSWRPVLAVSDAVSVVAGTDFSCALLGNGSAKCWGNNSYGQLGDGTTTSSATPVDVLGLAGATALSAGQDHVCAILGDTTVTCWGSNANNQVGNTAGLTGVTAISAGLLHTCAIVENGAVKCWGRNNEGQSGRPPSTPAARSLSAPWPVPGITGAVSIGAGGAHSCAVLGDGTAVCWGTNNSYQLGNTVTNSFEANPQKVVGLQHATAIVAGSAHTCALLQDGRAQCWGAAYDGQLGGGDPAGLARIASPRDTKGLTHVSAISANIAIKTSGYTSGLTCAVADPGKVYCWGSNVKGIVGDGSRDFRPAPVDVMDIDGAVDIAAGGSSVCALLSDTTVKCWGRRTYDNPGPTATPSRPVTVTGLLGVTSLGVLCASSSAGAVYCWGGSTPPYQPVPVAGISDAISVTARPGSQECAVTAAGAIKCWGDRFFAANSMPATVIDGVSAARAVATSPLHRCALISDGTAKCWGYNPDGELGNGLATPGVFSKVAPVAVSNLTGVTALTAAQHFSCALLATGGVKCWGAAAGGITPSTVPLAVDGVANALSISSASSGVTGRGTTCAVLADKTVTCWGADIWFRYDRPGNPPDAVPGLSGVKKVAISDGDFACALLENGRVRCWGDNRDGQLGDGSVLSIYNPVPVAGLL